MMALDTLFSSNSWTIVSVKAAKSHFISSEHLLKRALDSFPRSNPIMYIHIITLFFKKIRNIACFLHFDRIILF